MGVERSGRLVAWVPRLVCHVHTQHSCTTKHRTTVLGTMAPVTADSLCRHFILLPWVWNSTTASASHQNHDLDWLCTPDLTSAMRHRAPLAEAGDTKQRKSHQNTACPILHRLLLIAQVFGATIRRAILARARFQENSVWEFPLCLSSNEPR